MSLSSPQALLRLALLVCAGSQLLGNVPIIYSAAALVARDPALSHSPGQGQSQSQSQSQRQSVWLLLAFVSTVSGNLLLSGSACSVIVAEKAARHSRSPVAVTAWEHACACLPATLLSLALGLALVMAIDSALPLF